MNKVKRGGWLSKREALNESFLDGSEDACAASTTSTTCSLPVRSQRSQKGDMPMKGVEERIEGSWRLKDDRIGKDPLDQTEGYESVLSVSGCRMPVTKEKKKIGDFWKSANGEKTENILELSYEMQRNQIELMNSMQELLYNFRAIEKKLLQSDKDFTSKFDNLEQMISKIKIIPADTEVKRGSKISNSTRNKKKKKRRKAVMAETEKAQKDLTMKKIPKSDESKHMIYQSIKPNYHFQACTDDELHVLADAFDVAQFTSGSVISAQFEKLEYFYVIEEGSVDIFIDGEYIRSVKSFETFGDESLVLGCSNTSTFRARDDCKLWAINRIDYRNITGHYRRKRLELKTNFLRNVSLTYFHSSQLM